MSAGAPSNAPPRHCSDHAEAKLTDRYSVPPTYFSWLEMPEKVPLRLVPSDKTTAMMAAAMPARYEAVFDRGRSAFVDKKRTQQLTHESHPFG
jgi:hypothetical protein